MRKIIIVIALMTFMHLCLSAEDVTVGAYQNATRLISSNSNGMVIEFTLGSFMRDAVNINGDTWYLPRVKKGGVTLDAGYPQVPVLASSVIIPPTSKMTLDISQSEYVDLQMQIAPSKGSLTRDVNPDSVPYSFGGVYNGVNHYPETPAYLTEPFILRDYRGITVRFQPFIYYPETGITRVYTKLVVTISDDGVDTVNTVQNQRNRSAEAFKGIYENMFLNFGQAKYPLLDEEGRILVIKNSMFDAVIQPWVDWKRQMGFDVSVVDVNVAGPSANQIKTYIQNEYNLNNGLMFVQIMGDAPQVPTLTSYSGGSDPSFTLLAGSDNYPDIYIGRFSAQTVAEMETQVTRSIHYERDLAPGNNWIEKAMGIASNEGGGSQGDNGESDITHMNLIRTDLLGYGYDSVDQIYDPGASPTTVSTNINAGRGFINYVGHGSNTTWVTTGFSNSNVNSLTNDYKLPFIVSVACVNGNFVSTTCFAEAWMRATNNTTGAPTGALTIYASTINQDWNPPMRAQDEITDLLIAETRQTVGGLFFNGSSKMIEVYGTNGGIKTFNTWHIFGDASIVVRTKDPVPMFVNYSPILLIGMSSFALSTVPGAKATLSSNGVIYGRAQADASGNALINLDIVPSQPMQLTLTITAFNKQTHISTIDVFPANGPYIIVNSTSVSDTNNGIVEYGETVTISVNMSNVGSETAQGVSVSAVSFDPYVSVLTPSVDVDNIPANSTGSTLQGISLAIAPNVPNQYEASYTVTVTLSNGSTYSYDSSFVIAAPVIAWEGIQVNDLNGNSNGIIDPGELVIVSIPLRNVGNADTPPIQTSLVVSGGTHFLTPLINSTGVLSIDGMWMMENQIAFSSQIPAGSTIQLTALCNYGEYSSIYTYDVVLGILQEDFESGFNRMPWVFSGGAWTIEAGSYNGSLAAKSAQITHNETTTMSITLTNPEEGFVSFWKRLSSETNDRLKFYINGVFKNSWSGTTGSWSQVSYLVSPGTNTYMWEFSKNVSITSGNDCAWIDDIVFPAEGLVIGTPQLSADDSDVIFGNIPIDTYTTQDFIVSNSGDALMIGSILLASPFTLGDPDAATIRQISFSILPGESMTFPITFRPTATGIYNVNMTITTDDPLLPSVVIQLIGSSSPSSIEDQVVALTTSLIGNYPNPFNPSTTISFSIKEKSDVSLDIFNVLGQRVKTLVSGPLNSGKHTVSWDGKDDKGKSVASGMYFYRMQNGKYSSTKKMILMK